MNEISTPFWNSTFNNFRLFNGLSWMAFGLILFLSGFGHQSFLSTLVRNGLFAVIGFSLSIPLRFCYNHAFERYHSMLISGIVMVILSFLCGMLSGLILNPITFYIFRDGLGELPFFALFAGVLNFTFVFMIWSLGYHAFKIHLNKSRSEEEKIPYLDRVAVDNSKLILLVKTEDITHIKSDGEYIRIYTQDNSHLVRKPLGTIEQQLDPMDFQRIHRSIIVNKNFIGSLKPHANGEYYLILTDGTTLKLSRSYKHVVKSLIGAS